MNVVEGIALCVIALNSMGVLVLALRLNRHEDEAHHQPGRVVMSRMNGRQPAPSPKS